jgi:hypothetical protein
VAREIQQDKTQKQKSHKITPLGKQISSQSHTKNEGHITANEYNIEGKN